MRNALFATLYASSLPRICPVVVVEECEHDVLTFSSLSLAIAYRTDVSPRTDCIVVTLNLGLQPCVPGNGVLLVGNGNLTFLTCFKSETKSSLLPLFVPSLVLGLLGRLQFL